MNETVERDFVKTEEKIELALNNFKSVAKSDNPKFEKIDSWLVNESNMYLKEIKQSNKNRKYFKFKRGTIIKVNFGVNPGSELCHMHFAIVLDVSDNFYKESLTVIPLSSKVGYGRIPLGKIIQDAVLSRLKTVQNGIDDQVVSYEDFKMLNDLINTYKKYKEFSYADIAQITTISKSRIIYSKNRFDPINKVRCSETALNLIDQSIINLYTKIER